MAVLTGSQMHSLLSATTVLAFLAPTAGDADDPHDEIHRAIVTSLPHYDPAVREKALAERAKRDAELPPASPAARSTAPAPAPAKSDPVAPPPRPPGGPEVANEKPIELPKIEVRSTYPRIQPVPRLSAEKPVKEIDIPDDPYLTRAARDEQLLRKHASKLERLIDKIPLIGGGLLGKVRDAEAREQKAKQMNAVADAIAWEEALGRDPAEVKKLRDEYEKLYYSGPSTHGP